MRSPSLTRGDGVVAVGTTFDAHNMTTEEVLERIATTAAAYAQNLWDEAYAIAELHDRKDWTVGVNGRPKFDDFYRWYKRAEGKRIIERASVYQAIVVYKTYSSVPEAEKAAEMIKEMATLKQAYAAIRWAKERPDRVIYILTQCQEIKNERDLRAELARKIPLKGYGDLRLRGITNGNATIKPEAIIAYLGEHPAEMIADQMFVLRAFPRNPDREWAWYAVIDRYLEKHEDASVDEIFSIMFAQWLLTLSDEDYSEVLEEAERDWRTIVRTRKIDDPKWPF